MTGPAPKQIIQPADGIQSLHAKVSGHLNQAGHPATPQSVNPDDQTPLKKIEETLGDTTHVVGSTIEEVFGSSNTTHVRTTGGKVPILIALRKRFLKKAVVFSYLGFLSPFLWIRLYCLKAVAMSINPPVSKTITGKLPLELFIISFSSCPISLMSILIVFIGVFYL